MSNSPAPAVAADVLIIRDHGFESSPAVERYCQALDDAGLHVVAFGWDREANLPPTEQRPHFRIERIRLFRVPSGSKKFYLAWFLWQFHVVWRVLTGRERVVHACDFNCAPAAWFAARLRGKAIIYDIRDPASISFPLPGVLRWLIAAVEQFTSDFSSLVIIPDETRLPYLGARARRRHPLVLYNAPRDRADLKDEIARPIGQTPALRLNFCGYLHAGRGLNEILALAQTYEHVQVDMVGNPRNDEVLQRIKTTPRVTYHGTVANDKSQQMMAAADLIVALYDPALEVNRVSCPNKLYEAMMLGRPILTNDGINLADMVRQHGIGYLVEFGQVPTFVAALERVRADRAALQACGQRARQLFVERFGWNRQSGDYVTKVRALLAA